MSYQRSFAVPASVRSRIRLPLSEWKKHNLVLDHLRPVNGALVLAEASAQEHPVDSSMKFNMMFNDGTRLVLYSPSRLTIRLPKIFLEVSVTGMCDAAGAVLADGARIVYLLGEKYLFYLRDRDLIRFSTTTGGTGLAYHGERVFYCSGMRVNWSKAYPERGFAMTDSQAAGYFDHVDETFGNILKLVSMGDYIYLFHEHGISRMYVTADALDFRVEKFYTGYTNLHERSIGNCGDKLYFFADGTLFSLTHNGVCAVPYACTSEIDFSQPVTGTQTDGEYYASVVRSGVRQIYCYDKSGVGRFIGLENIDITGSRGIHLLKSNEITVLTGSALPQTGEAGAKLEYDISHGYGGRFYLEAVTVEGKGMYEVEACANGVTRRAKGKAGDRLFLNGALAGIRSR